MSSETNQDGPTPDVVEGEGKGQTAEEIKLAKAEYEELIGYKSTVGSLKRELKDIKKSLEGRDTKETPSNQTEEFGLLQETYLRTSGKLETDDEIELAKKIQKETKMPWDALVRSKYFTAELQGLRNDRANAAATDVSGGSGSSSNGKEKPEYWIGKGTPPTSKDVPDRKTRVKIQQAMIQREKYGGGKFYNE